MQIYFLPVLLIPNQTVSNVSALHNKPFRLLVTELIIQREPESQVHSQILNPVFHNASDFERDFMCCVRWWVTVSKTRRVLKWKNIRKNQISKRNLQTWNRAYLSFFCKKCLNLPSFCSFERTTLKKKSQSLMESAIHMVTPNYTWQCQYMIQRHSIWFHFEIYRDTSWCSEL